ncbi:hypothetical protein [Ferriphaselus sp. R-1]|uniref:hypothetical protein n=1 Tax=Ferriphaselus sp. R-1 TaxID=1485544 RepID=UPI001929C03C|nr:hypothetical protein [Ferriphaselus sp. R-1]
MLNLYEVVRYGNDSECVFSGGPNGPDTCFLVRAASPEAAAAIVDPILARMSHERVRPWAHQIHWLGEDRSTGEIAQLLRGPYVEHAYGHSWPTWQRGDKGDVWEEKSRSGA